MKSPVLEYCTLGSVRGARGNPCPYLDHLPRRIAISLFMEWRQHQRRPEHLTTTDFQTLMAEEHRRKAIRFVLNKRPCLKNLS
jgi:hypothetical protein